MDSTVQISLFYLYIIHMFKESNSATYVAYTESSAIFKGDKNEEDSKR